MFPVSVSFCFSLLICSSSFTTSNYLIGSSDTEDGRSSESTIPYTDSTTDNTSPGILYDSSMFISDITSTEVSANGKLTCLDGKNQSRQ
jgi:hypothetical protein